MAFVGSRIPDQLASRFEAFAAARGGKSKVLRSLMEAALGAPGGAAAYEEAVPSGRTAKITLRLKPDDLAALDATCKEAGMRRTEWLVALARRRLHGMPQWDRSATIALLEARRDLRRLGVNLREMAEAVRDGDGDAAQRFDGLRYEVRTSLEGLRQAMQGNLAVWDADAT